MLAPISRSDLTTAPAPELHPDELRRAQEGEIRLHDLTLSCMRQYAEAAFAGFPGRLTGRNWAHLNQTRIARLYSSLQAIKTNSAKHLHSFEIMRANAKQTSRNFVNSGEATNCLGPSQREAVLNLLATTLWIQALMKEVNALNALGLASPEETQRFRDLEKIWNAGLSEAKGQIDQWKTAIACDQLRKEWIVGHTLQGGAKTQAVQRVFNQGLAEDSQAAVWVKKICTEALELSRYARHFRTAELRAFQEGPSPLTLPFKQFLAIYQTERLLGNLTAAKDFLEQLKAETGSTQYDAGIALLDSECREFHSLSRQLLIEIGRGCPPAEVPEIAQGSTTWSFRSLLSYMPSLGTPAQPNPEDVLCEQGKLALAHLAPELQEIRVESPPPPLRSFSLNPDMFER